MGKGANTYQLYKYPYYKAERRETKMVQENSLNIILCTTI